MEPHKLSLTPPKVSNPSKTVTSSDVTCPSQVNHAHEKTWSRPEMTSDTDPIFLTSLEEKSDVDRQTKKQRTKRKLFSCRFCDYVTNRKGNRDTHLRTHSGERPYKCRFCHYAAAYRSSVVVHERRHTGERPYRCPACTYSALQKTSLNQHMLKHHSSNWHHLMTKASRADRLTTHPTTNVDCMAVGYTEVDRMGACMPLEPPVVNNHGKDGTTATEDENTFIGSTAQKDIDDRTSGGLLNFSKKEGQVPRRPSVIRRVEDSEVEVEDGTTPGQIQDSVFLTIPSVRSRLSNNSYSSHTKVTDHRHVPKQNQGHIEDSSSKQVTEMSFMEKEEQSSQSSSAEDVQKKTSPTGGAVRARTLTMRPPSDPCQQHYMYNSDSSANKCNVYPLKNREDIKLGVQSDPGASETRTTEAIEQESATFPGNTTLGIALSSDMVTVEANPRDNFEALFSYNLPGVPHVSHGFHGCYYCGIIFTDKIMHDIHASYHGLPYPFRCNVCGLLCPDRYAFYLHLHRATHR